jgi:hypothetical protein
MPNGGRRLAERISTAAAILVCCVFCCLAGVSPAGAQATPTEGGNVTGWMWSRAAGWISLNCSNFGTCGTSLYGVNLEGADSGPVKLTGFAWSDILGWICFGETCGGTNPENIPNYAEWRQPLPPSNPADQVTCTDDSVCSPIEICGDQGVCQPKGRLYGWAKVVSLGNNGWIALNCDNDVKKVCGTSNFFVVFDQGKFTLANPWPANPPDPNNYHWAWSANDDGTGLGWIDTSMVFAPWAPPSIGRVRRPEGIYEPDIASMDPVDKAKYRPSTINIIVERVWSAARNRLECLLFTSNGSRRLAVKNFTTTANYGSSAIAQYTVMQDDDTGPSGPIQQNKRWVVRGCRLTGPPNVSLPCSADAECPGSRVCDPISGFCRKVLASSPARMPIYVHSNRWTLFNNNEDYYQAIKCYAGFPGQYFNNAPRCDFAGDASFSMAMSKGLLVKRNCHGLPDITGATDCSDSFFCSGISYMCKPKSPTRCVWANAAGALGRCSDSGYEEGDLCCSHQPIAPGSQFNSVVNGLECTYQDPTDGYYDCDCTGSGTSTAPDCYPPYYQAGDLCCDTTGEVTAVE